MGNPVACQVALKSIDLFESNNYLTAIRNIETQLSTAFKTFNHPNIKSCRVLGATAAIEVNDAAMLKGIQQFAQKRGVWLRPFDRYLYTTPPYTITQEELSTITTCMKEWFL